MKISFSISGSDAEIRSFFSEFMGSARTTALVDALDQAGAIVREDIIESPGYAMLEEFSWASFYLCHIVRVHGATNERGDPAISYNDLEQDWGIGDRSVASRVGGTVKIATRLSEALPLYVEKRGTNKYCGFRHEYKDPLEHLLKIWKHEYAEWLKSEKLSAP